MSDRYCLSYQPYLSLVCLSVAPSCYYGKNAAQLVSGEKRRIEDLKAGDRVWSIHPTTNELVQDEIILMMHNEPNKTGKMSGRARVDSHRACTFSGVRQVRDERWSRSESDCRPQHSDLRSTRETSEDRSISRGDHARSADHPRQTSDTAQHQHSLGTRLLLAVDAEQLPDGQ